MTAAVMAASMPASAASYTTPIDPSLNYGAWQGWGASLSWWANVFGMDNTLADIFYTTGSVAYHGRSLPGLGLNVVRYNLGASMTQPAWPGGPSEAVSPNQPAYRKIEGYWVNWLSDNPADTNSWSWWGDSEQRNMVWKARDRGADVFQVFSCSPIWWMCNDQNPCGAADGGDNLQSWNYQQHARYVAIVAQYFREQWGVDVGSVDPFNEPSAPWWTADGAQEGCHISADLNRPIQQKVIRYLREELDARGLSDIVIAASDENSYDQANTTWSNLAALGTQSLVGQVNVHGYQYTDSGSARSALHNNVHASDRPLWQSEYGEQYEHGLYLAYNLALDLRYLHPTAWCYWQPVDSQVTDPATGNNLSWGLLKATYSNDTTVKSGSLGEPNPCPGTDPYVTNKYFVLAQYTRHIRPGMQILDSGDPSTVAAYDPGRHRLVLVTVRGNTSQDITYDLSRFSAVGSIARRWVTDADPYYRIARQYETAPDAPLNGKQLTISFGANSIQTIEIDDVWI
ncbi:glycoside hydrolase [Kitasatospora sp. NPDC059747]|uniref:glycoside hydrolase n=1 Tax=Kitasatospora sp. NPDC059747 TaxID=3346930 RepID=UPI003652D339